MMRHSLQALNFDSYRHELCKSSGEPGGIDWYGADLCILELKTARFRGPTSLIRFKIKSQPFFSWSL